MRKIALVLAAVLVLLMPVRASAAVTQTLSDATLTIADGRVNFEAYYQSDASSDYIVMDVLLWRNQMCLLDETVTGYGVLTFSDYIVAFSGWEYTLEVKVTVNGTAQPAMYDYAYCP